MDYDRRNRDNGSSVRSRDGYAQGWQGVPIHYTVSGCGEPVLACCNGLGVSTFFWKYLRDYFAPSHRIITWEYRGHYRSGAPRRLTPRTLSMAANARDLLAVLDAAGVSRAVILGHSMGCQVLLEFWKRYPERVAGLIPICGPYGRPFDTLLNAPRVAQGLFNALYAVSATYPRVLEAALHPLLLSRIPFEIARRGSIHPELATFEDMQPYFEHLSRMDLQVFFTMAAAMQRHNAGPWLHTVNVPTLVVGGESDTLSPLPLALEMRDKIHGAEFLRLPKGSHVGLIEHPELLNLRIEKFLRERVEPFLGLHTPASPRRGATAGRAHRRERSASRPVDAAAAQLSAAIE